MAIRLWSWTTKGFIEGLRRKFDLEAEPRTPDTWQLIHRVFGVTQLDPLLRTQTVELAYKDLSGAAGGFVGYFTVPKDKRWTLIGVQKEANTANGAVILRNSDDSQTIRITDESTSVQIENSLNIPLPADWEIGCIATGNGADNNRGLVVHYLEEDGY